MDNSSLLQCYALKRLAPGIGCLRNLEQLVLNCTEVDFVSLREALPQLAGLRRLERIVTDWNPTEEQERALASALPSVRVGKDSGEDG